VATGTGCTLYWGGAILEPAVPASSAGSFLSVYTDSLGSLVTDSGGDLSFVEIDLPL
jgi:hypothetical protein